ncbi:hypothetical protein [Terriglobus saanensis]|uniref:Flagellar protein FlgJ-like protein n=1 Tax=Terriglobus saanensis (strain ATCC BAA-1853 / DSM 23119 / SP1PR4) TaxID=401053 RepID=E8V5N3_TERSS|nr:hypothetical protein [Terriglobus saanensis]ADV82642.1 hypothetical protein AciPR4_1836 [Terriglobus saanensis SP1PR4]
MITPTNHLLPRQASSTTPAQHRIVDAAQKFESILLGEMLKPLREKSELNPDTDSDGTNDTLISYGTEALAQAMVKGRGIGIAKQIVDHFAQRQNIQTASESR